MTNNEPPEKDTNSLIHSGGLEEVFEGPGVRVEENQDNNIIEK